MDELMNSILTTADASIDRFISSSPSTVRDYITLLKPGVMSLVVFSGAVGMLLAPGHLHPVLQWVTLLCIAMGSGGGAAINMWYDRDIDRKMLRTANRPVAAGRIAPGDALAFGVILSLFAVVILGLATNWRAAGLLAFATFFYAVIYTIGLKRRTPQNIVIGGAAGAFPPVIGWLAAGAPLAFEPLVLFLITFLWTPPHFWALALYRSGDYARAGVPMLPVTAGAASTRRHVLAYSVLLALCTMVPVIAGYAGNLYAYIATGLNLGFLWYSWRVFTLKNDSSCRRLFAYSILYLFAIYSGLLIDTWIGGAR